jgi:hypothetical protein
VDITNPELNFWLGIFGAVTGVLGLITGYIFYRRGLRVKEPVWSRRSVELLSDKLAKVRNLTITYKDGVIDNLTMTRFLFINLGKDTINASDLAPSDPIRIKAKDKIFMLDAYIVAQNNKANKFNVEYKNVTSDVSITFDYVDCNEGVVIMVYHTGKSRDVEIVGSIKGAKLKQTFDPNFYTISLLSVFTSAIIGVFMGFQTLSMGFIKPIGPFSVVFALVVGTLIFFGYINIVNDGLRRIRRYKLHKNKADSSDLDFYWNHSDVI